jgi:AraC-like DNA-binding protein
MNCKQDENNITFLYIWYNTEKYLGDSMQECGIQQKLTSYFSIEELTIKKDTPKECSNYEIYFIFEGDGVHIIDTSEYECDSGVIFFLSPSQMHHFVPSSEIRGYKIEFNESFLVEMGCGLLQELSFIDGDFLSVKLSNNQKCTNILSQLIDEYNNERFGKSIALRSYLVMVLIGIQRAIEEENISHNKDNYMWSLKKEIRENNYKIETVEYYAKKLNISADYLNKIVKQNSSITASKFIREKTILQAKRLLAYTDDTIESIGEILGFVDSSYFRKFFKRETSIRANEYREAIREKYPIKAIKR